MLVFGKTIRFSSDIKSGSEILDFLTNSIQKIEFDSITNFYTADFQKFYNETEIKFRLKIGVRVYIFYRYKSRYYDDYIFSTDLGAEFEF
jgi:diaminopimelate decarboxylase